MKNLDYLKMFLVFIFSILFHLKIVQATSEIYTIDPARSTVEFSISNMGAKVSGKFQKFSGTITVERDAMEKSEVKAEIDTASVDTNQKKRDKHLQTKDFFTVDKFPTMNFQSKTWKKISDKEYEVVGDFTLLGITKPVTLAVKDLTFGESSMSVKNIHGKIKRSDFGMTYGKPATGDDVEIDINVEAKKQ
jgi:polyisoprenoid-binding protein YceI